MPKALPVIRLREAERCFLDRRGYVIGRGLSAGSFGKVYRATRYDEHCAVKLVNLKYVNYNSDHHFAATKFLPREIYMLKKLKHPNVTEVYDIFILDSILFVFMELANGDLASFVYSNKNHLPEDIAGRFFFHTCLALEYMHSQGFSHRDIKGENVLLFKEPTVAKLADFGMARRIGDKPMSAFTYCGTILFMAPEVLKNEPNFAKKKVEITCYCPLKADVWSMGILLYFMLNQSVPFHPEDDFDDAEKTSKFIDLINSRVYKFRNNKLSDSVKSLIFRILKLKADERPRMEDILDDGWFKATVPKLVEEYNANSDE